MTTIALGGFSFSGISTLAQQFPTNLNEVWSTTLENTSYAGFAFTAKRADNSASFNISFVGKHADPSAASNFSGTTAIVTTVYGQINGLNAIQIAGSTIQAFIDTDGYWSFGNVGTPQNTAAGLKVADNALLRPSNPHIFCLINPGPYTLGPPYGGQGLIIEYGGTGLFYNVGRYGFGINLQSGFGFTSCQNGSSPGAGFEGCYQYTIGEALADTWHVWDHSPSTLETRFDAGYAEINSASASTNITYTNTQLNLLSDFNGNNPYFGAVRLIALYGATLSSTTRNAVSNFLLSDGTTVTPLPTTFTDTDGFTYTPDYFPYHNQTRQTDQFGLQWADEHGGYQWPSFGVANNLTNSASTNLVRFELHSGDSDITITDRQRAERNAANNYVVSPGNNAAMFAQFLIEPGSAQTVDFAFMFQIHTTTGNAPDLNTVGILNDLFQPLVQRNGLLIKTGTYNSTTGLVTLTTLTSLFANPGDTIVVSGATGTGSFASINGTFTGGAATFQGTITYIIATGLTMTINGTDSTAGVVGNVYDQTASTNGNNPSVSLIASPPSITRGIWYNYLVRITWSTSGQADSLQIYLSPFTSGAMTKVVDINTANATGNAGQIWTLDMVSAYVKQGLYCGDRFENPGIAMRIAGQQWSSTLTAFDSFIASPPALPTH